MIDAIIDHSRLAPNRIAAKDAVSEFTYSALIDEVARHATGLYERGVDSGDRVAILMPNSVDFVVASLACLWLGAIFVPLSPSDPEARLKSIVDDCAPKFVIVRHEGASAATDGSIGEVPLVSLRTIRSIGAEVSAVDDESRPCYIIYTSGTTGTPKGVLIGDAAFDAALRSTVASLGLNRDTRALCVSPFHFDGSYGTLFATLYAGGSVYIRARDELLFPRAFFNTIESERITFTGFTPSYLRLLLSSPQISRLNESTLEVIALGGEAGAASDIIALWSYAPKLRLFNRYGPTETTIAVTHASLSQGSVAEGTVSMGRPHPHVSFFLADDGVMFDEVNRIGELYVGGVQLMDGYWGDWKLSEQVLRDDVVPGERVYRTGDLVYREAGGDYVYVNRADRVVKRNGVRISLIELDETVRGLPHVNAVACLLFDDDGTPGIVAFVVTDGHVARDEVINGMMKRLPESMMPNPVEIIESLPMTNSNKLDERLLLSRVHLHPLRAPGLGTT